MLELKGVPVVKVNAERTALMNVRDHVEVLVKVAVKMDVKPLAWDNVRVVVISVQVGVLNHVEGLALVAVRIPVEVAAILAVQAFVVVHVLANAIVQIGCK